ncbi:MAG: glycosyltransferase [Pirellulales bacterium]
MSTVLNPMSSSPLVTVIMPTYQRAALIGESIDSVYAQTYANFELLVIDDGSTDETESVVRGYDARTRYIKLAGNAGPSRARNVGLDAARGELIAMLDSDDLWLPTKTEKQVAMLTARPELGWVYCDLRYFGCDYSDNAGSRFQTCPPYRGKVLKRMLLHQHPMMTPTIMVRKTCFAQVGVYDVDLRFSEDADLYNRLSHRYEVDYIDEVLVAVRRETRERFKNPGYQLENHLNVMERIMTYDDSIYPELNRAEREAAFVRIALKAAYRYRRERAWADCRRMVRRGLKHNRLSLAAYRELLSVILKH